MKVHVNKKFNKLLLALGLSGVSLIVGILGYTIIEHYHFIDALYMTVLTISTVGFREVQPLSEAGRVFTSVYIIFNLSVFAFVISVFTRYFFEGGLKDILSNYMSEREVKKLKDHVIICGYGRNGYRACEEIRKEGIPYVVVDPSPDIIKKRHGEQVEINVIEGDATHEDVLRHAGIERAKAIIAAVPRDSINVFITLTARELNPSIKIISRAVEPSAESKLYRAGATYVVMPDSIGGHYMASLVSKPHVVEFLDMINGIGQVKLDLEEVAYKDFKTEFQGMSIRDLNARTISSITFIGAKNKEGQFEFNPNSHYVLEPDDLFIVIGSTDHLNKFLDHFTVKPWHLDASENS